MPPFMLGGFAPPIDYGIQMQAPGRGGPGVPLDARAAHMTPWPPSWGSALYGINHLPMGAASSLNIKPALPNLFSTWQMPVNLYGKQQSSALVF